MNALSGKLRSALAEFDKLAKDKEIAAGTRQGALVQSQGHLE
jgi:hypothetical protein